MSVAGAARASRMDDRMKEMLLLVVVVVVVVVGWVTRSSESTVRSAEVRRLTEEVEVEVVWSKTSNADCA